MLPDSAKKLFLSKYSDIGQEKFYKFLLSYAINKSVDYNSGKDKVNPAMEMLEYHDKFMILYRREGDYKYIEIAKLFRKTAHKIYRILIKKNIIERNAKFLNTVD
jgi:hypothetical protein